MMTVHDFQKRKRSGPPLSMVTAYDHWTAKIINQSSIDCVLVGDSAAMVMHGHSNTLAATPEMMAIHIAAVAKGCTGKFIVGDMPFLSHRQGLQVALEAVALLMRAGCHAVKIEGVKGHEEVIRHIVESGVPVMGHLGLTPQSIHGLGGMRVQAKDQAAAELLLAESRQLEKAGCFALVLECVPSVVAETVTKEISIPTVGIGAGHHVDGQVLVLQDLLGADPGFKPRFLRPFADLHGQIRSALGQFDEAVKARSYPSKEESYTYENR